MAFKNVRDYTHQGRGNIGTWPLAYSVIGSAHAVGGRFVRLRISTTLAEQVGIKAGDHVNVFWDDEESKGLIKKVTDGGPGYKVQTASIARTVLALTVQFTYKPESGMPEIYRQVGCVIESRKPNEILFHIKDRDENREA